MRTAEEAIVTAVNKKPYQQAYLIIFRLMTANRTSCHGKTFRMERVRVVGLGG